MRSVIIDSIFDRMRTDPDVFFVTADMGINLIEKIEETYPKRYANVGIAEQNLIGVSAGLANLGYRPFAYTISNFAVHRCFEQVRNEIGVHGYPVTLLGTSTGYDNAPLGPTHHIIDDWGALKTIPGIDIYCPSSKVYAATLVDRILDGVAPAYVRIPKGSPAMPDSDEHMVKFVGDATDILVISYGSLAQVCMQARDRDPRLSVLIINRLRPINHDQLVAAMESHSRIFVVEDHFPQSGLFGSICEFVAQHHVCGKVRSLAPRNYTLEVGASPDHFHRKYGIDADSILRSVGY